MQYFRSLPSPHSLTGVLPGREGRKEHILNSPPLQIDLLLYDGRATTSSRRVFYSPRWGVGGKSRDFRGLDPHFIWGGVKREGNREGEVRGGRTSRTSPLPPPSYCHLGGAPMGVDGCAVADGDDDGGGCGGSRTSRTVTGRKRGGPGGGGGWGLLPGALPLARPGLRSLSALSF